MNAYQLASKCDEVYGLVEYSSIKQAATMLRQQADRIAELEKDLALKTRDRDVFCDLTLAYEKRIAELEKDNKKLHSIAQTMGLLESDARKSLQNFKDYQPKPLSDDEIEEWLDVYGLDMGDVYEINKVRFVQAVRAIIKASRGEE